MKFRNKILAAALVLGLVSVINAELVARNEINYINGFCGSPLKVQRIDTYMFTNLVLVTCTDGRTADVPSQGIIHTIMSKF